MNFFAEQDKAKRNTWILVLLMIFAVASLIALTIAAIAATLYFSQTPMDSPRLAESMNTPLDQHMSALLSSDLVVWASLGVLLLVSAGSLYKYLQLGGSGKKVALALGGRQIQPNTRDADERKILNVVEEMSIASGNPVPPVFIIEESGINAFAAGKDRRSAVIGITRGCIEALDRDELQGVVAHEFSHIHFGDMRLNIKLVAVVHGILLIGLAGSYMLRSSAYGHAYRSRRNKNSGAQLGIGLALMVLGYVGVFFGNMIKAAVSRQREFLADASAVQFTRNPSGIANALKKIGGHSRASYLESPAAGEFSHFYFGQGVPTMLSGLLSTHPPLQDRIKRIEPRWNGKFIQTSTTPKQADVGDRSPNQAHAEAVSGLHGGQSNAATNTEDAGVELSSMDDIGQVNPEQIDSARALLASLPDKIYEAAHDPFMARALIYCLLIDQTDKSTEKDQIDYLSARAHPATYKVFLSLLGTVKTLPSHKNLPLLELAIPALKMQSQPQYQIFKQNLIELIKIDKQVSLFEWCLYRSVTFCCEERLIEGNKRLSKLSNAISVVIAATCFAGEVDHTDMIFETAESALGNIPLEKRMGSNLTFKELDKALNQLSQLNPMEKPRFLKVISECIKADKKVTAAEAELFRAIADTLNCPAPLLPTTHNT